MFKIMCNKIFVAKEIKVKKIKPIIPIKGNSLKDRLRLNNLLNINP